MYYYLKLYPFSAFPEQTATGLHGRLYARSFYVKNCESNVPWVYVTIDNGMASVAVKRKVLKKLAAVGVGLKSENIIYSGTHTHSGLKLPVKALRSF